MTVATCLVCGTRTDPGVACTGCGTPVPAVAHTAAEGSGQRKYWQSIQERLTRATAPKYHVTGLLGYGGMAGVFAADEPRLGRRVALKVLSPALMVEATLVERFMQEARTIAQLSHPNIVPIHEVDERDGLHWFTMTFVPGRTLGQVMDETVMPIPVPVARVWLYQIGDALAFAHAHGIVHRDIKPGNVLLDLRGNAMVTDFGIAKVADVEQGLTRTGLLVGTPTYMSPEQCHSTAVTGASDQYSLGAMLYELLTGTVPFTGPTFAVLQGHMSERPIPIRDLRPDCPESLAASIHRMLEKRPEERWPSLAAALTAAGATPPGVDDPVRVRIEELAAHAAKLGVEPLPTRLSEGSRDRLRVTLEDASGRVFADRRIEWISSAPAIAVVAADTVLALSPGSAELTATCGGASLSFEVAVDADPIGAVEVAPASAIVHAGEQVLLDAVVADLDRSRLDGRAMLWSTSDPAVARVSAAGVVTGVAPGDVVITARSGGKYAASKVTVTTAATVSTAPEEEIDATLDSVGFAYPTEKSAAREERAKAVRRRRTAAIVGAATAVVMLAVVPRIVPSADRGQPPEPSPEPATQPAQPPPGPPATQPPESARSVEPTPVAPTGVGAAESTAAEPRAPQPDAQGAPAVAGPPAEPAPAESASILVAGDLPAGATVTATDRTGRTWPLSAQPIALAADHYVLEFHAPGYESERHDMFLSSGQTARWTPDLRPVPPAEPPPAPPARDAEADQSAIDAAVRQFVGAFDRRDAAVVLPLLPSSERRTWRLLLESDDVTDFSATLSQVTPARIEGDAASVSFAMTVSYHNQNRSQSAVMPFIGNAERRTDGWRLVSLDRAR